MESAFGSALADTIESTYPGAVVRRPSDRFTLGVPDILAWIPVRDMVDPAAWGSWMWERAWSLAIELKEISPLMEDPFHRGRRTGLMLKREFTGPQMSTLRKMKAAGVDAFGLVRAAADTAFRIEPKDLPMRTGNFTHEELIGCGRPVRRFKGKWRFWETPK